MLQRKPSRYERAKSETLDGRSTVSGLKENFRNNFFNRLRVSRSKSVDRLRQICEGYTEFNSIHDLKKLLCANFEASVLLETDEVAEICRQIQEEINMNELEKEAENHIQTMDQETHAIVNNLMNKCAMCDNLTERVEICEKCVHLVESYDVSMDF